MRVVGLALLAFVVWKIEWRDSIVLASPAPDGTKLVGEVVGEIPTKWDADARVVFRGADGVEKSYAAADLSVVKGADAPTVGEGLIRIVRRSDKTLLLVGFVLYGFITQFGVLRWWLLLRAQGIRIPYGLAHRLTFLGFFFNNVVPGPTGGDVVKAVYAVKRTDPGKKAQAVVTVLIDRVAGIVALALIAAFALASKLDDRKYQELAWFIGIFLGGFVVGAAVFFSRTIRRVTRFEHWSAKLPGGAMIRTADEALFLWRGHLPALAVALLLSFANQLSIQGMMIVFGHALHQTIGAGVYMAVLPVPFIVSAVPMLPGGWGMREAAFAQCFGYVGVARNPAIAMSVLNGMTQLVWSLLGGVYFLRGRADEAPRSE